MSENNVLRNLGAIDARNEFNNIPMEFIAPKNTQVIFVSDFYTEEVKGGAEMTSEALISFSPYKIFKIHSQSMTVEFLKRHKDLYFVISNFVMAPAESLSFLIENNIKYSVIEYDYKYCSFRSEVLHKKQTGHDCDCPLRPNGMLIEQLYEKAQKIFWMSEAQKEHFLSKIPSLIFCNEDKHIIQGSTFTDESINKLLELKTSREKIKQLPFKTYGVQSSGNWIKGTEETVKYCNSKKFPVKVIPNMEYSMFLTEIAKCNVFVFHPLDKDTAPRVVIEAKLMGLDLDLNDNVQIKNESWLNGTHDDLLNHLKSQQQNFWKHIQL